MRCLERNQRAFLYALYQGRAEIIDEAGNRTGEYRLIYAPPVNLRANIGPATGQAAIAQFGETVSYDRVLVLDDPALPIDEHTILWIAAAPDMSHDAIVRKVARSLNSVSVAIKMVDVRE